jgi:hypothetical protein
MKRIHSAADAATLKNKSFAIDTTFVLFFLALEFGRSLTSFGFDGFLLGISLAMVLVLPFFFSTDAERPEFGKWLMGRSLVASLAVVLGTAYGEVVGVIIPDSFRFLPMTLLIVTAMVSCYVQFYGMMRLRPAK